MALTKAQGKFSQAIDDGADATAITIDSSGSVGINTVSASGPQSTFHIEQNGDDADGGFRLSRDNALASYTQYINTSSVWNLAYGNPSSDDSLTNLVSVTASGRVGIGTGSDAINADSQLHVKTGNISGMMVETTADSYAHLQIKSSEGWWGFGLRPEHNGALSLRNNATGGVPVVVTTAGNVAIGIASSSVTRLRVYGVNSANTHYAFETTNHVGNTTFIVRNDGAINTGTRSQSPYNNSISGRDVYVSSSGWLGYLSSTRESKENIQSLGDISWVYDLNPVSFNYRQQDETFAYTDEVVDETEYGLIADEVEQVNADLCFYDEDEEGNQTLAGVSYRKLIPVLTKAIQEQQTIIEDLQTRLSALEAN